MYRWERRGYIVPYRTPGNHRRYDYDALVEFRESRVYDPQPEAKTGVAVVYARVSSSRQREDLKRQVDFLSEWARRDGFRVKVYSDIGSGLNDARPRMPKLLKDGLSCQFVRVYITFLDRLARFGTRPLVEVLKVAGVDVAAMHVPEAQSYEKTLVADVIALVTSFAGKIRRRWKGKNAVTPPPAGVLRVRENCLTALSTEIVTLQFLRALDVTKNQLLVLPAELGQLRACGLFLD